jgi:spore coat polysaccharide biosynthesis predicted glycosyltransferase SpsG
MNFVFWAGASIQIGTGHIMRLVPIAEQLVARGYTVSFLADQIEVPWLHNKLVSLGPKFSLVQGEYIPSPTEDILLVDSYEINVSDEFFAKKNWLLRVSIGDDNTPDYGFQLTVVPGFDEMRIVESPTRVFASGKDYFLFRNSIRAWRSSHTVNEKSLRRIVVSGGGTDPTQFGPSLIKFLDLNFQGLEILLFSNSVNVKMNSNILEVIEFGVSFDEHVKECYLAFCPSSTMAVELAAAGIPVGIGLAVQNQTIGHSILEDKGLACPIGNYEHAAGWRFDIEKISYLLNRPEHRDNFSSQALEFFDLDGAIRVAELILTQVSSVK